MRHLERHRTERIGWLRAAVLGANDGIVSTASLIVGVAAANPEPRSLLLTGLAGLVAGAMSMAAGEYVSVHSQADTEGADLARERAELQNDAGAEQRELTDINVKRGLDSALAAQVAEHRAGRVGTGRAGQRDQVAHAPQRPAAEEGERGGPDHDPEERESELRVHPTPVRPAVARPVVRRGRV